MSKHIAEYLDNIKRITNTNYLQ